MRTTQVFLLLTCTISASALRIPRNAATMSELIPRASTVCGGITGYQQCGGNFPSDFCCQSGTTCFGFNGNQSVVCCPAGKDCTLISTNTCNPSVYNATAEPTSSIHMSNLSSTAYTQCGSEGNCCPAGYLCKNGGCTLDLSLVSSGSSSSAAGTNTATTSSPTSTQTLSSAAASTPSTTVSLSMSSTGTAGAQSTFNPTIPSASGPQFPVEAILIGLLPGLAVGCLICFLIVCCIGRRRARKQLASDSSSSLGPTIAKISDPIYSPDQSATRTDFLRQQSRRIAKKASSTLLGHSTTDSPGSDSSISRMRSLFRKTGHSPKTPDQSGQWTRNAAHVNHLSEHNMPDPSFAAERAVHDRMARSDTVSTTVGPRTPKREPSMESIPIYNNTPDAGGYERNTVFADLLPSVDRRSVDIRSDESAALPNRHGRKQSGALMPPIFLGSPPGNGRDRGAFR